MFDTFEEYNPKSEIENIKKFSELELVKYFQDSLISRATGGGFYDEVYSFIRNLLIKNKSFEKFLPNWVKTTRTEEQFWQFIKYKYSTYAERRKFLWEEFAPLLNHLEAKVTSPLDEEIVFDDVFIHKQWQKAIERKDSEPEGAITAARTLLESVLKYILDEKGVEYKHEADLPELYKTVAKELNLAPEQHQEQIFKQILSGTHSVVYGLGTLRNKLGDAHGQRKAAVKPSVRHSEFAVNLAGATAMFLYKTFKETK
ncbi:abortive infection family protein [Draconibacterium orientale]|uniref:abortive infection family protein n=1 Tax=Draconibacterium orientale TaxID=1168034 RepID=UPI002ABD7683|nr:abortive infection family protein [Draconibacterium orientale]